MDYKSKLTCLNKTINTTTNASGYISTSRIISFITNENHLMDNSLQSNIARSTINENIESIVNEIEEGDIFNNHDNIVNDEHTHLVGAAILDITEEQSKMNKRFQR